MVSCIVGAEPEEGGTSPPPLLRLIHRANTKYCMRPPSNNARGLPALTKMLEFSAPIIVTLYSFSTCHIMMQLLVYLSLVEVFWYY